MQTLQATSLPIMFSPKNKQYTGLELTFLQLSIQKSINSKYVKQKLMKKCFK